MDETQFEPVDRAPDFNEFLKVLRREPTSRPVLYELYLNNPLYSLASGQAFRDEMGMLAQVRLIARAFANLVVHDT